MHMEWLTLIKIQGLMCITSLRMQDVGLKLNRQMGKGCCKRHVRDAEEAELEIIFS